MNYERLSKILVEIRKVRIGVIGDFCLDAYWIMDAGPRELSLETGKATLAVTQQTYSHGGAGNVVKNLVDIGAGKVYAFAVIGEDIFGHEMLNLLQRDQVNTTGVIVQKDHWQTSVYAKPYLKEEELERIDFGRYNVLSSETEDRIIEAVEHHLPDLDALIVNQQLPKGIYSEKVVSALNSFVKNFSSKIYVINSRDQSNRFHGFICRLNACEAARLCGEEKEVAEGITEPELKEYARKIYQLNQKPIFISRGARGVFAFDGNNDYVIPGIQILKPVDPVGAGDTGVSAMTAALCIGAYIEEAAELSNFSSAVTVQKLRQTGTATPSEILEMGCEADYVYNPELAQDIRGAFYINNSEIERVHSETPLGRITHVIFDQDGTLSCLRQGWDDIMESMMVQSILGDKYTSADPELYQRVIRRVRDYIDRSTGIETILQMQALVEMVKDFGIVPETKRLDAAGYKEIYNAELMRMVQHRIKKLEQGELEISDVTIKGAVSFLKKLYDRGIKLYLASGTDMKDVIREAQILGYANLFEERIYGYSGDLNKLSKKIVVDNIIQQNHLSGSQLACFGDGPVEIREVKKRGGIPIGVASDEIRRFGLSLSKRERLIKAGADIIIPDYSQGQQVLNYLLAKKG